MPERERRPQAKPTKTASEFDDVFSGFGSYEDPAAKPLAAPSEPRVTGKAAGGDKIKRTTGRVKAMAPDAVAMSRFDDLQHNTGLLGQVNPDTTTDVVVRTARDLPKAMSTGMMRAGYQNPDFHQVSSLPGNMARAVEALGKQLFGSLTRTPTRDVYVVANLGGNGPNTDAEVKAVAEYARSAGVVSPDGEVDFSNVMPGYKARVAEYSDGAVRYLVVRDDMGQYVYSWPEQDSIKKSNFGRDNSAPDSLEVGKAPPRLSAPRENVKTQMKGTTMRKLSRIEAFGLMRKHNSSLKESGTRGLRLLKREDMEEGEVYAVVGAPSGGDATVTFKDGDVLVGPFASEDDAKTAVGDDVQLVSGDPDNGAVQPADDDEEGSEVLLDFDDVPGDEVDPENAQMKGTPMPENKAPKSNHLRLRQRVNERIRARVKADILRESETLDIDTDVKAGSESSDKGAGNLDSMGAAIAAPVADPKDTGPNPTSVDSDSDPAADNSDDNVLEARKGQLVSVYDAKSMMKVDSGIVESISKGKVKLQGGDEYKAGDFQFRTIA